ncbi:YWFCY domain-containing protein, partial [Bacteroides fragilis]
MEESKELQGFYKIFRTVVYVSVLLEFFEYAIDPAMLDHWGGILTDIHGRIKQWMIYHDGNLVYSKIATVLLICITCVGTRNKKHLEFNARRQVVYPLTSGLLLLVISVWMFGHTMGTRLYTLPLNIILYMIASIAGVVLVHIALDNISKFIKEGLMKDRFNFENESFEQCEEKVENEYSVNIPMRYYYKGKFRKGWISVSNCFRGTWVVGTPGSGKTFSIIEPFIRQHSAKGFAMVVYDYKFPTLATKLYYHYKRNEKLGRVPKGCKFNMINFVDVEYSRRVNPIQAKYINNLAAASETAETLLESLQKGKKEGGGGSDQFFQTSAVNFLAACIYFFVNYEREPYDANGKPLYAERQQDPQTKFWKPTGIVRDREGGNIVEPAYWLGKYSDMPHILSFLNESYQTIFEVLETDN